MSEFRDERENIVVIGGGAGGRSGELPKGEPRRAKSGAKVFNEAWLALDKNWDLMPSEETDDLDAMWLAASIGKFLAENNFNLTTGGYDSGVMGMVNRSARIFSERKSQHDGKMGTNVIKRVGVPLPNYFPEEVSMQVGSEIRAGENLSDRLESLIQNSNAFIVMRGAHGTLNELTTIIEEEDLRHESGKADNQTKFCSRPIIIADPSGYTEDLLNYIFGKKITKFKNSLDTNILDQIYFLPKDSYITSRETPLMATVSLSEKGKEYMAGILEAYSNGDSETICNLGVKTLRNAIGNSYSRVKE